MAVSGAQLSELRRRQDTLRGEIGSVYAQIESERGRIEKENAEKLELLINDTQEALERRDERLRAEYGRLLDGNVSEQERILNENLRGLQEQYRQVCNEVSAALAEERRRTEEALVRQRNFEEAYNLRREFARETAKASLEQAREYFEALSAEPAEWFMPGHLSLYRSQLGEINRLIGGELYESAAAAGDDMLLSMRIDMTETGGMFRRWFRYYQLISGIAEAQRKLIFESFLRLPERLEGFRAHLRAARPDEVNGRDISEELADRWLDGGYEKLKEIYRRDLEMLAPFRDSGGKAASGEEAVKRIMLEKPDISVSFGETAMYRNAAEIMRHREEAEKELISMHGRMEAFEERLMLARETAEALSRGTGYDLLDLPPFGAEGEAGVLCMTFADGNNVHTADVMLVPVRSYYNGAWTNSAVWFYSEGTGEKTADMIGRCLADIFVKERRIPLSRAEMSVNQTREERVRIACGEMQLMRNLRLN